MTGTAKWTDSNLLSRPVALIYPTRHRSRLSNPLPPPTFFLHFSPASFSLCTPSPSPSPNSKFHTLYLCSHQLPTPSKAELHARMRYTFNVSAGKPRALARYGSNSFGLLGVAEGTAKSALQRGDSAAEGWKVAERFGGVLVASRRVWRRGYKFLPL